MLQTKGKKFDIKPLNSVLNNKTLSPLHKERIKTI